MQVVLLAGGLGTRISEETEYRPKPMIEVGGMPIIWHIMKEYSYFGFNDFIICAGYKHEMIKKWFVDYAMFTSDITVDLRDGNVVEIHDDKIEPWRVTIVNTGLKTMTGGRIKRIGKYIEGDTFMMTYGDGVCDVDIKELLSFHKSHGKIATLTSVKQVETKGTLDVRLDKSVRKFREKSTDQASLINAGYMVFERDIFKYLRDDSTVLETDVLPFLAEKGELMSYMHEGFWQCMDTIFERKKIEELIATDKAPWMRWRCTSS